MAILSRYLEIPENLRDMLEIYLSIFVSRFWICMICMIPEYVCPYPEDSCPVNKKFSRTVFRPQTPISTLSQKSQKTIYPKVNVHKWQSGHNKGVICLRWADKATRRRSVYVPREFMHSAWALHHLTLTNVLMWPFSVHESVLADYTNVVFANTQTTVKHPEPSQTTWKHHSPPQTTIH